MAAAAQFPGFGAMGGMHTAGIYSDMTVDGPEIGTLVVVVDRAKNLPNRKTMGKQNPYCAARLGKEAKKTETDKRGGQTPKWDQELRFTVHESPDYNNLKVSVFNDDKKTDMIGEMWVTLDQVIVPGGGKNDGWHQLSYKGKYAGEVMLELTYYDSRPDERSDRLRETAAHTKKIKRRPLPTDNLHTTPLPHQMENTRTAGPRAMGSRTRASSSVAGSAVVPSHSHPTAPAVQYPRHQPSQEDLDYHPGFSQPYQQSMALPDLPELPPSRGHRGSMPAFPPPRNVATAPPPHAASYHGRVQSHPELPHSHSAPMAVPQMQDTYNPSQDPYGYTQALVPQGRRRYDEPPGWDGSHTPDESHHRSALQPTVEDDSEDLPPLPPSHRNGGPPPPRQGQYVSNQSPLQSLERRHADNQSPRGPPARSQSVDDYAPNPPTSSYGAPDFRKSYSGPPPHAGYAASGASSSSGHARPSSSQRMPIHHSASDPYNTPPRAHPLAQEMRRSTSPAPHYVASEFEEPHRQAYPPEHAPIIKPRAISPAPSAAQRHSLASIRHPVQSFGLSNSPSAAGTVPPRKSVSPRPVSSQGSGLNARPSTSSGHSNISGGIPFSPDDYSAFNPSSSTSSPFTHSQSTNPHSPYHIPNGPPGLQREGSEEPASRPLPNPDGPITTWDGRTVDPSDHLPVHSWAPEPVKKSRTPEKSYGAGGGVPGVRGLSGPRSNVHNVPPTGGRVGRDFVVNVRNKHSPNPSGNDSEFDPPSPSAGGKNRLIKARLAAPRSPNPKSAPHRTAANNMPLNEIDAPNPYAGGYQYSDSFSDSRAGVGEAMQTRYHSRSPGPPGYSQQQQGGQQRHYGDLFGGSHENSQYAASQYTPSQYSGCDYESTPPGYTSYADRGPGRAYSEPPELPPKIPFSDHAYGASALERELQRIDIGGSRRPGSSGGGTVRRGGRYGG